MVFDEDTSPLPVAAEKRGERAAGEDSDVVVAVLVDAAWNARVVGRVTSNARTVKLAAVLISVAFSVQSEPGNLFY